MSTCPATEQLVLLLDEGLDESNQSQIVAHVQNCLSCQERLDEITRRRLERIVGLLPAATSGAEGHAALMKTLPLERPMSAGQLPATLRSNDTTTETETASNQSAETTELSSHVISQPADPAATCDLRLPPSSERNRATDLATVGESELLRLVAVGTEPQSAEPDRTILRVDGSSHADTDRSSKPLGGLPRIPGYELLEKLGQGGMGVVFKARQVGLNRLVAVKMIRGGGQARPEHFARFRLEAEAVAQLRHPNIIQIYDVGQVEELPFVSLELLDGGDLGSRMAGTPQPGRAAAEFLVTLTKAIEVAHEVGIVHRDLKPPNILFSGEGVPKVTDFGLAKRLDSDSNQTETGQIMGSPSYMAPEQARGHAKDVGPAADLYALGAILYEMLTGRPPFKGESPIETVRQVTDDEVVPPSRLVPKVARDLETICLKCLNKEPSRRYESARALAEDLERFLAGKPIKARPISLWERGLKWARRRPVAATWLVIGAVGFLGLAVGGLLYEHALRVADGRRTQYVLAQQDKGNHLIEHARDAATQDALTQAEVDLWTFRETIKSEERLQTLGERVAESLRQVRDRLEQLRSQVARQERDRVDRARFQTFLDLRNQAQLHATGINLDPGDRPGKLLDSARQALAIFAKDRHAPEREWALADTLPAALTKTEQSRVADGCYDLLLLLSQAMEPKEGLPVLDRAARLRPEPTAAYHLRRADCLARTGDLAGRDREEALARQRPSVTALDHFLIGREQCFRRQYREAIRSLDNAVRLDPNQTAAHLLLAVCYFNHQPKRLNEARTSLSTCIGSHPDLPGLYLLRALIYGEEGNLEAAESDYASVIERQHSDDYHYALLVNRGIMYLHTARLDQSLSDLQAAIDLKPGLYQAHMAMAQLHERQGRLEAAAQCFSRAIAHASDPAILVVLYRSRALLHAHRKDLTSEQRTAAIRDLDEAIRRQPAESPQAADDHVNRARLLFGAARRDESLTSCDFAIRLVSDHPEAHRQRIATLMALKRYDEVLGSCDAYLAREKPTVEILEISGLARLTTENYPRAISDLTQAIALRPEPGSDVKTRLLNRRGWAYHFADAPRLALADFEASLKLVDDQSDAFCGRGLARIRLGQWRPAVADAETAIRLARILPTSEEGADVKSRTDFNAARIYAQAVEFAAREVSREGERAVSLYRRYHARALALLDEALRDVPDAARRQVILDDPALKPLRLNRGVVSTNKVMN